MIEKLEKLIYEALIKNTPSLADAGLKIVNSWLSEDCTKLTVKYTYQGLERDKNTQYDIWEVLGLILDKLEK